MYWPSLSLQGSGMKKDSWKRGCTWVRRWEKKGGGGTSKAVGTRNKCMQNFTPLHGTLRWLATVLMDYHNGPTLLTLLKNVPRWFYFSINCLLQSFTIICGTSTMKRQQMAKMNDRVPSERLGTTRLNHVVYNFYPYDL